MENCSTDCRGKEERFFFCTGRSEKQAAREGK